MRASATVVLVLGLLLGLVRGQGYSFLTLGDWGGADTKPEYKRNVLAVAAQMAQTAVSSNAKFVINLGDSFYWCGLKSLQDQQIAADFTGPFASMPALPWYSVLGNHGYGYSADVQVQYSKVNPNWIMPSRYYTKRKLIDSASGTYISFIFLDTSPCVKMYRSSNSKNYDPCGPKMPTCSLSGGDDDFEGKCNFHANIMKQSCDTQYAWFKRALNNVPANDWLIVVGHHPADEINVRDFTTLMQNRGFSIYFNGHAHTLTQYTIDGSGAYVTSGAGSLVNTPDQSGELMKRKLAGDRNIVMKELEDGSSSPMSAMEWYGGGYGGSTGYGGWSNWGGSSGSSSSSSSSSSYSSSSSGGHTYQTVWNKKVAGFTLSTFSADFQQLTTQFISYNGNVLKTFTVNKSGAVLQSPSSAASQLLSLYRSAAQWVKVKIYGSV